MGIVVKSISSVKALEPLPPEEQKELDIMLVELKSGWQIFRNVGTALGIVAEKKLFRSKYLTFEEFCLGELGYSRPYAYNLIGSAEVSTQMSSIEDITIKPVNEAQCRELINVPKDKRADAWKKVIEVAGNQPVTAKIIHEVVAPFKPWSKYRTKAKKRAQTKSSGLKSALKLLVKVEESAERSKDQSVLEELAALRKCLEAIVEL